VRERKCVSVREKERERVGRDAVTRERRERGKV